MFLEEMIVDRESHQEDGGSYMEICVDLILANVHVLVLSS